mgnify:CR=1 FL=1
MGVGDVMERPDRVVQSRRSPKSPESKVYAARLATFRPALSFGDLSLAGGRPFRDPDSRMQVHTRPRLRSETAAPRNGTRPVPRLCSSRFPRRPFRAHD